MRYFIKKNSDDLLFYDGVKFYPFYLYDILEDSAVLKMTLDIESVDNHYAGRESKLPYVREISLDKLLKLQDEYREVGV
jgi:hypothetical protein